jgi:site-specific DNA-methyltransferase (adenine-specific)
MKLLLGDCLDKLKELEDNSVDSVVTDPPYEIGFMGKGWDDSGIANNAELWKEVLRVLKPGGHLLSFSHSRTYHRQAVAVEDAGFEIRDQIMWVYGSGFPKSMDISKQIDKKFGKLDEREVVGTKGLNSYKTKENGPSRHAGLREDFDKVNELTAPVTDEAKQWGGWGTALKPAHEPIVMARKPLSEKTVADNVLEWGTGGINIDGCRVGVEPTDPNHRHNPSMGNKGKNSIFGVGGHSGNLQVEGRFPANIIFDEEAGKILDEQSGISRSFKSKEDYSGIQGSQTIFKGTYGKNTGQLYDDRGGASRFFYCPKTSKAERNEGTDNNHPTVKPTDLMAYLIRLVTPKGGIVLDPFMGSGSTGKAAVREGMEFIGIERENEYFEIAKSRIEYEINKPIANPSKTKKVEVEKKVEEKVNQFFG